VKSVLKSILNFRRYYRKIVQLPGEVIIRSSDLKIWRIITVCDISMQGLRFSMLDKTEINKSDKVRVRFYLDN